MRFPTISLAASAMMLLSTAAAAECELPAQPALPDGATASQEEMSVAMGAFKGYQSDLTAYRACLDEASAALGTEEDALEQQKALLEQYNESVDAEANLAERFNEQVRAYRAQSK